MNEVLLKGAYSLKEAMKGDARFLELQEKEEAALKSNKLQELRRKMEEAAKRYEEALSYYSKDSKEIKELEKGLFEAKKAFDNHPLMKEYTAAFSVTKYLTLQMDDILFGPFRKKVLDIKEQ